MIQVFDYKSVYLYIVIHTIQLCVQGATYKIERKVEAARRDGNRLHV